MNRLRTAMLWTITAVTLGFAQEIRSITGTATFNNIGIEVVLNTAPATGTTIEVSWNPAVSSLAWHNGHPLSRIATSTFAGSVFGLSPNTPYLIRLKSAAFSKDTVITVTTRAEGFPQPTGSVYHVAVSGSDSREGSSLSQAFATLSHALTVAMPGATILLHSGHYYESVTLPRSGTAAAPICIRNAPGETAVLDGRDTSFRPVWSVYNAGAGVYRTACTTTPQLAYLNSRHLFANPALNDLVANTWDLQDGFFADGSYLYVRFPGGRAPASTDTVQIPRFTTGITVSGRDYIQIKGLEICCYGLDEYPRGIYFDGASFNLVDSCYFHRSCVGVAFKRACRFNTIQHCSFTEGPIDTWNWSAVKEGTGYYEAGGVIVYGSANANIGNVIRNNHFFHMFDGSHLYSDDAAGPTSNMDFHDNLIEYANDDCVETDGAGSNCRIYNNVFRNFLTGVSVAPAERGPTYIMRNLFSAWETHSGYVGYPVKFNVGSSLTIDWVYLYHNTCHTAVAGQPGFLFKQYSNWNNIISRNNIYAGTDYALESTSSQNPVDFDYDDLFTTASNRLVRWAGSSYTTVTAFSTATGQEKNGRSYNPRFVTAGTDYHLAAGSQLIDSGIVIPGINDDYSGNAPDIGRYEYGAQPVAVVAPQTHTGTFSISRCPHDAAGEIAFRVYTGPVSGQAAVLSIYSMSGKLVFRRTVSGGKSVVRIKSNQWAPGLYFADLARSGRHSGLTCLIR